MNTEEVVIRKVQCDGGFQVRQFLAESVREPRKAAKLHSHGEVLPLHIASRNVAYARSSDSHLGYGSAVAGAIRKPRFRAAAQCLRHYPPVRADSLSQKRLASAATSAVGGRIHETFSTSVQNALHTFRLRSPNSFGS